MIRVYSEKEIWADLNGFFKAGDWNDPLKKDDPNDLFYGMPYGDAKLVEDIMAGQPATIAFKSELPQG